MNPILKPIFNFLKQDLMALYRDGDSGDWHNLISATIADMYDPEPMDSEFPLVREAHDRNDEIIERIYIGRQFVQNFSRGDTDRLEKLFELYAKMTIAILNQSWKTLNPNPSPSPLPPFERGGERGEDISYKSFRIAIANKSLEKSRLNRKLNHNFIGYNPSKTNSLPTNHDSR
jgi:hypothetical protein